jgi:putative transposase
MRQELVIDALEMAWSQRSPDRHSELIFHSVRGNQYASQGYRMALEERHHASMNRKGNAGANACSETLFGSLKVEQLQG